MDGLSEKGIKDILENKIIEYFVTQNNSF